MTTVERLKHEIERLTFEEKAELMAWLHGWEDDEWDKQMKADAEAGRLDHLIEEADRAAERGDLEDLP